MAGALFEREGDLFVPTDLARGPWDRNSLHGGPVAALATRAAEQAVAGADPPLQLVRLTVDLVRPVPSATPLAVHAEVVRPGRKVQMVSVSVRAGGTEVTRALALFIRAAPVPLPDAADPDPPPPGPDDALLMEDPNPEWEAFHNRGVEMRFVKGYFLDLGPAVVWVRLRVPVVAGEEPSPAMRAAAAADFGNGVSGALPFYEYLFINPDLTVLLHRPPVGEWVCLDAVTHLSDGGIGLAESALFDRDGRVGRSAQTLLVDRR